MVTLAQLQNQFPRAGTVVWIGVRPERRAEVQVVQEVYADSEQGLVGDHYSGRTGKRHVTLIDRRHLDAVAAYLARDAVDPAELRRNIVVDGFNLLALKDHRFRLGEALLEYTDQCHPCSRMEENLGVGGYNAMRGHGGICARVVEGGRIAVGDALTAIPPGPAGS